MVSQRIISRTVLKNFRVVQEEIIMTPASAHASIATANSRRPADVPGKAQTATFFHRSVRFSMDHPSEKIQCNGENHLITSIVRCLGEGHLLCRDCQLTSGPAILTEKPKCPFDGTDMVEDIVASRSFAHVIISCPSATTFEPCHEPACTWKGAYREVKSHLDECNGIPDNTKLMMQGLQLKELQAQLTNSEKKQSAMIQSLTQKYEALDQRKIQQLKRDADNLLPLLTRTVGCIGNVIGDLDKIRTRLDRLEARTGNMERQFNSAVFRSARQSAAESLAAEQMYLTNLQQSYVTAGSLSPLESSDNTGRCVDVFLWRIDGFQSWLADAVTTRKDQSHYCPAFYTTDRYCVSGQISSFEQASASGYFGVFIAVWKGQYDEQIRWPMSKIITLSLVNQNAPARTGRGMFASGDRPGFQKPQNRVNNGWGIPEFLSLSDLGNPEIVQNYSLHIQIKLEDSATGPGASERHH